MDKNEFNQQSLDTKVSNAAKEHISKPHYDEIDLIKLWRIVWDGKWKIIAISSVFAVMSVFYALSLPNIYKSDALLMPNSQSNNSGALGALAGQFGGLASLAGINLKGASDDKTAFALEIIRSREFLYKFIEERNLKPLLMALEGWNQPTNTLLYNAKVYDKDADKWLREVKAPLKPEPSLHETYDKFIKNHLVVSQDKETGTIKVSVLHYSPYVAKELVDEIVKEINKTVKLQDEAEATKSIQYLERELENTNLAGMKALFYQLIENQQQTLMLSKVRDDYVFKVIDKAVVPELKHSPRRAIICIVGTIFGGIIGVIIVVLLSIKQNSLKAKRVTI